MTDPVAVSDPSLDVLACGEALLGDEHAAVFPVPEQLVPRVPEKPAGAEGLRALFGMGNRRPDRPVRETVDPLDVERVAPNRADRRAARRGGRRKGFSKR